MLLASNMAGKGFSFFDLLKELLIRKPCFIVACKFNGQENVHENVSARYTNYFQKKNSFAVFAAIVKITKGSL